MTTSAAGGSGGGSGGRRGSGGDFKPDAPGQAIRPEPRRTRYLGRRGPASKAQRRAAAQPRPRRRTRPVASPSFGGAARRSRAVIGGVDASSEAQGQPRPRGVAGGRGDAWRANWAANSLQVEADVSAARPRLVARSEKGGAAPASSASRCFIGVVGAVGGEDLFDTRAAPAGVAALSVGGGGGRRVRVRADGSAVAKWGGGGVAVLVEKAKAGHEWVLDGGLLPQGNLAVSFDASRSARSMLRTGRSACATTRRAASRWRRRLGGAEVARAARAARPGTASVDGPGVPPAAPPPRPAAATMTVASSALAAKAGWRGGGGGDAGVARLLPPPTFRGWSFASTRRSRAASARRRAGSACPSAREACATSSGARPTRSARSGTSTPSSAASPTSPTPAAVGASGQAAAGAPLASLASETS